MAIEQPIKASHPAVRAHASSAHRVAIVGAGPTGVYTLRRLVTSTSAPLHVDIFEKAGHAGPGMPYSEEMNDPCMLSNIASRELPPVVQGLDAWLRALDVRELARLGLAVDVISEEAFYPRIVLGTYLTAQMAELVALGRLAGHSVELHRRHRVEDVCPVQDGIEVAWQSPSGAGKALYDDVVLATGHAWPDSNLEGGVRLVSPWPAEKIRRLQALKVGVLGTSLSAIDIAATLASARGVFVEAEGGLEYRPSAQAGDFEITLMSRKGLLPEADYWYELPLPELPRLAAIAQDSGGDGTVGLLDDAFRAFLTDLEAADPQYVATLGAQPFSPRQFHAAYFAERLASDAFDWARRNLAQAKLKNARKEPTPWRSALLRAHELFEEMTPRLAEEDLVRFHEDLKPVFTDCYACVPHSSIERLLAMKRAGVLKVARIGENHEIRKSGAGVVVAYQGEEAAFDTLVDGRGQKDLTISDLGFPSLSMRDLTPGSPRFETYSLPLRADTNGRIHCLSLPVLLRRHPFAQGLVNAHEMGEAAAGVIQRAAGKNKSRRTLADK